MFFALVAASSPPASLAFGLVSVDLGGPLEEDAMAQRVPVAERSSERRRVLSLLAILPRNLLTCWLSLLCGLCVAPRLRAWGRRASS